MNVQRFAILLTMMASVVWAQKADPLLVNTDWLTAHLKDRNLVLLHVGPKKDYDAGHIPGARYIQMEDVSLPMDHEHMADTEIMLELPVADDLRKKVASFGISDDSRIIVYYSGEGIFQSATRIVFALDYLGLGDHTSILNGGMPAWQHAGKPLTAEVPRIAPGKLTPKPTKNVVADAAVVKAVSQHPNEKLVDARAAVYYNGIEPTFHQSGHIPGAISIPYTQILDGNLTLDRDQVAKLFSSAGIKPGDKIVAYCHIGQQATAVVFAARLLGYPVMLYDGAFQDWAVNKRGPVEK